MDQIGADETDAHCECDVAVERRGDGLGHAHHPQHSGADAVPHQLALERHHRQVLGQRYPVLYQHAIHGLQRYHHLDTTGWPRLPPWPVENLIEHYQTMPDAWREG